LPPETAIAQASRVVHSKQHFVVEQLRVLENQLLTLNAVSLRPSLRASQVLTAEFERHEASERKAIGDATATHKLLSKLFPRLQEARHTLVTAAAANPGEAEIQRYTLHLVTQLLQEHMPRFRRLTRDLIEDMKELHARSSKLADTKAHQLHASAAASGECELILGMSAELSLKLQHDFCTEAKHFRFDNIKRMVSARPALVNVQPSGRWSALHQAASALDAEMVRWLLEHGADPLAVTREGKRPVHLTSNEECIQLLSIAAEREELARLVAEVTRSLNNDPLLFAALDDSPPNAGAPAAADAGSADADGGPANTDGGGVASAGAGLSGTETKSSAKSGGGCTIC